MHATAHSNINSKTKEIITKTTITLKLPCPPNNVSKRCPAIIFAANRIARVMGRITDLTVSIKTITGINTLGVPDGTR